MAAIFLHVLLLHGHDHALYDRFTEDRSHASNKWRLAHVCIEVVSRASGCDSQVESVWYVGLDGHPVHLELYNISGYKYTKSVSQGRERWTPRRYYDPLGRSGRICVFLCCQTRYDTRVADDELEGCIVMHSLGRRQKASGFCSHISMGMGSKL